MKKVIFSTVTILCFLLLLLWNPVFLHTETSIPSAGNTGAPGDQTCGQGNCHTGNAENLTATILSLSPFQSDPIANGYVPNTTHSLFFSISLGTPKYGFQIMALDQNNNSAGTFVKTDLAHTELTTQGGKQYLSHKNARSQPSWGFKWTAPATDIGPVTFYYTAIGANGDSLRTGDVVYRGRTVVTTSSFSQLNLTGIRPLNADDVQTLKIFPNPFSDNLSIEYFLHNENQIAFELFDLSGKSVKLLDEDVAAPGYLQRNFSFEEKMKPGIYVLKISEGEKVYYKKLLAE